jgi:hypothetical protein
MLWSTDKAVQIGSAKSAAAYDLTIFYAKKKKKQISITHTREGMKISMMWQFCAIAGREGIQLLRVSSSKTIYCFVPESHECRKALRGLDQMRRKYAHERPLRQKKRICL